MTVANTIIFYNAKNKTYFDSELDEKKRIEYYCDSDFIPGKLHSLLVNTHIRHLKYSPYEYVYPWVDLQESLQLKSLYSGHDMDPVETIEQDVRLLKTLEAGGIAAKDKTIFNTEHVVPQSWFDGDEPMRGDLHHLFACEPGCNSMRSNYPYYDFEAYEPEIEAQGIRTGCGMAEDGKFEPEYGKGIAARAVFYFALRYLHVVKLQERMDFSLLLRWHNENPVTVYEKHRNLAIQELQGNRNPFIDFPDRAEQMLSVQVNFDPA